MAFILKSYIELLLNRKANWLKRLVIRWVIQGYLGCLVINSPGPLLHVSLCHGLLSIHCHLSFVSFSHFRHLLQNHVGLSWNLMGGMWLHGDLELLKLFRSDIQDCHQLADILKFFKWHLLSNSKLDWAQTWWEYLSDRYSELLK